MLIDLPDDPEYWNEMIHTSGEPTTMRKTLFEAFLKSIVMENKQKKINLLKEKLEKLTDKKVTLKEFFSYSPEEVITTLNRGKDFDVIRSLERYAAENPAKANIVKAVVSLVKEYEQSRMLLKAKEEQIEQAINGLKK